MTLLIDTATVPSDHRIEAWSDAATRSYHPVGIRSMATRPYVGRMARFDLGAMSAFIVAADPNTVLRTSREIAMGDPERLDFYVLRRGRCLITQDTRTITVSPGDMTYVDSSRPYLMRAMAPFELISYSVPKSLLGAHLDSVSRGSATRISAESSVGSLMGPFLSGLVDRMEQGDVAEHMDELSNSIFGLLHTLAFDGPAGAYGVPSAALRPRIKAYIEAHLGERGLGPDSVAAAHFISVRYLHKLFEAEEVTVSEWIRGKRLDCCQRDLADATLAGQPIAAIAGRWGLTNGAHFSRLFRARFGCSPREFRSHALRHTL